jgi:hypothetical protein
MYYLDVNYMIRSRPNGQDEMFTEEWQISYNNHYPLKIKLGRFNRPSEPMFYGCVSSENKIKSHFLITSCFESCKELFDENNKAPFQYFTTGKWFLKEPFHIFNLCFNEKFLNENPKFNEYITQYIEILRALFKKKVTDFIVDFWYSLSDLAGKKSECDHDHFITTIFWCAVKTYIIKDLKSEANGIIFTSSMSENSGVNIVLTPEAVDKYLYLKSVFMAKFIRKSDIPPLHDLEQCSDECFTENKRFSLIKKG